MKRFVSWMLVLLLPILVVAAAQTRTLAGTGSAPAVRETVVLPGAGTMRPEEGSTYAETHGEPIEMPDLLGRSLEYATTIWDDDEPLPEIIVERLSDGPDLVVVRQDPAPDTPIVQEDARIVLTLGRGPVVRPTSTPTPLPDLDAVVAPAGQATLLRPPYVQNLTTTSLVIVWTTVEGGASEVRYGVSDFSLAVPATSTYFTTPATAPYNRYYVHEATLSGLAPDTVYQYKIFTNGADLTPGGAVSVRTAKRPTAPHFRFVVFGDSGDGSQNQKDVAARLLQVQPDLGLHTGDLIYNQATYDGFERRYFQIYKDLIKSVWIAPSMGNHDTYNKNGVYSFTSVFVNPPNGAGNVEREMYYSFDYGNAHFVVLNNYFSMTDINSAQYNWLRNDLATTRQFWKFVVFHEPPYSSSDGQPRDNARIVQNLVPLFEQYRVNMVLGGHWHYYERMKPLLRGQVSTIDAGGIVYIVTGGGGAGLFGASGALNSRTAVKVSKYHFTMVDIYECTLKLSAVQKVSGPGDTFDPSDIFDTYTINRCGGPQPTDTPVVSPSVQPTATPTLPPGTTPTATPVGAGEHESYMPLLVR